MAMMAWTITQGEYSFKNYKHLSKMAGAFVMLKDSVNTFLKIESYRTKSVGEIRLKLLLRKAFKCLYFH